MEPITTITLKLIDWLLKRNAKRTKEINSYFDNIHNLCINLIEINPYSDKATLLHEELKVMYSIALNRIPSKFIKSDKGWYLLKALSSARIYYWLRIWETKKNPEEIQKLIFERIDMSPSFEALTEMLLNHIDPKNNIVKIQELKIEQVRKVCLQDIANLLLICPFS